MSKLLRNGIPRKENGKIDLSWKNHYGFTGFIWVCGLILPPLAVAVRFGIGKDFFINCVLTMLAWVPGTIHNYFIQNIRNNDTAKRTPKWAIRYGLVDDRPAKQLAKSRAWTGRYNDRLPQRTLYDEDGNAYVVEETEEQAVAGVGGAAIQPQKTGLVDPDQWINDEPDSRTNTNSSSASSLRRMSSITSVSSTASKPKTKTKSKLFRRGPNKAATGTDRHTTMNEYGSELLASSTSRRSSRNNVYGWDSDEDLVAASPNRSSYSRQNGPTASSPTTSAQAATTTRRENDIFAHEF